MAFEQGRDATVVVGWLKKAAIGIVAFIGLSIVFGSFYTIESGKVGVIQTFGKYNEVVSLPGLHWKRPFIDTVLEQDVKLQTVNYVGGEDEMDESGIINKPHLDVLDAKNVAYDIEATVTFVPVAEKMPFILTAYGANYYDKRLNPIGRDVVRDVGGKYNVETIADHRDAINTEIRDRLAKEFEALPFTFDNAVLRKISLPGNIMAKITAVQEAKQEEERLKIVNRQAEQQKAITITNAEAEKAKIVIAAQADAEATLTRAEAQAKANRKLAESLTPLLVQQNQIEKWNGSVPQVTGSGSGLILQLGKDGKP